MKRPSTGLLLAVLALAGLALVTRVRWIGDPVATAADLRAAREAESQRIERGTHAAFARTRAETPVERGPATDLARIPFGERLLACTRPDVLLETLGDVPVWEAEHKLTGIEVYVLEYALKFERCFVAVRRADFDVDVFQVAATDFYGLDETRAPRGAARLSELLASTQSSRAAARARREAEVAERTRREDEARERREAEAAAAHRTALRAAAAERHEAELRDADAQREGARRAVKERLARLCAEREKTSKDAAELDAYYETERAETTRKSKETLARMLADMRKYWIEDATPAQREDGEKSFAKQAAAAEESSRRQLGRALAWLDEQRAMKLPTLERAASRAESAWRAADTSRARDLEAIEREHGERRAAAERAYREALARTE